MYYLSHKAEEIDEKIKRIPLASASETKWERTDDWSYIADQDYDPDSAFAQSGKAVAGAIASIEQTLDGKVEVKVEEKLPSIIQAISEDEIKAAFAEAFGDD